MTELEAAQQAAREARADADAARAEYAAMKAGTPEQPTPRNNYVPREAGSVIAPRNEERDFARQLFNNN